VLVSAASWQGGPGLRRSPVDDRDGIGDVDEGVQVHVPRMKAGTMVGFATRTMPG